MSCRFAAWFITFALGGITLAVTTSACQDKSCTQTHDCEPGQYCDLLLGESLGQCKSDCDDFWTCPEDAHCTAHGQCQIDPQPPTLSLTNPQHEVVGEPGDLFAVKGVLHFLGEQAVLSLSREDFGGCDPMLPIVVNIPGSNDQPIDYTFTFPDIRLPDGGGVLRVSAEVSDLHSEVTRNLSAGTTCLDCPRIVLNTPESAQLETNVFFSPLAGRVDQVANNALRLKVLGPEGQSLSTGLNIDSAGQFNQNVIPLFLGSNILSVEAHNDFGVSRCQRLLVSQGRFTDRIFASLTWEQADSDLDLHIVPPGGIYGPGDCSAAVSPSTRAPLCEVSGDAQAFGPETLAISSAAAAGVYGVIVVGFSGSPDQTAPASLRLLSHNRLIGAMGPRPIAADRPQLWVVGTVHLGTEAQDSHFVPLDQMLDYAPTRPPEDWPEFR